MARTSGDRPTSRRGLMRNVLTAAVVAAVVGGLAAAPAQAAKKERTTITGTVVALSAGDTTFDQNASDFDILREAVLATDLDGLLSKKRQLTVFAPTDQAFLDLTGAATEEAAFNAVASFGTDAVRDVLSYHVANGRRTAEDV